MNMGGNDRARQQPRQGEYRAEIGESTGYGAIASALCFCGVCRLKLVVFFKKCADGVKKYVDFGSRCVVVEGHSNTS